MKGEQALREVFKEIVLQGYIPKKLTTEKEISEFVTSYVETMMKAREIINREINLCNKKHLTKKDNL